MSIPISPSVEAKAISDQADALSAFPAVELDPDDILRQQARAAIAAIRARVVPAVEAQEAETEEEEGFEAQLQRVSAGWDAKIEATKQLVQRLRAELAEIKEKMEEEDEKFWELKKHHPHNAEERREQEAEFDAIAARRKEYSQRLHPPGALSLSQQFIAAKVELGGLSYQKYEVLDHLHFLEGRRKTQANWEGAAAKIAACEVVDLRAHQLSSSEYITEKAETMDPVLARNEELLQTDEGQAGLDLLARALGRGEGISEGTKVSIQRVKEIADLGEVPDDGELRKGFSFLDAAVMVARTLDGDERNQLRVFLEDLYPERTGLDYYDPASVWAVLYRFLTLTTRVDDEGKVVVDGMAREDLKINLAAYAAILAIAFLFVFTKAETLIHQKDQQVQGQKLVRH